MKVIWAGTFDPDFSRNRKVSRLLSLCGCETQTISESLWPADRVGLAAGRWWRLLARALWIYPKLVARLLLAPRPDLYFVSYPGWFDLPSVWLASTLKRRPILFDPFMSLYDTLISDRSLRSEDSLTARVARLADRLSLRLADAVIADTEPHLAFYDTIVHGTAQRGHVLPVGADDTIFQPQPEAEPEPGRVLFYGSFVPLHGLPTIVEAAALLADEAIDFVIVGDGQERPALQEAIARTGARVELTGFVPLQELPAQITRAQVCLGIFGDSDKAGRVVPHKVYECLAMARAVVTRDSPGVRSLLTDHEVRLVAPADPTELADAIRVLVSDPMLRSRLEDAGYATYRRRFHEAKLAAQLLEVLEAATIAQTLA
jgi:glycosyltransferase involved in cell wall biosynthesis